jgi:hypothetical protein
LKEDAEKNPDVEATHLDRPVVDHEWIGPTKDRDETQGKRTAAAT